MELPIELSKTMHKNGGRIERVYSIGHECAKPEDGRSRDIWFFVGDVVWNDQSASREIEIAPWAICAEDGDKEPEIHELMGLLNEYLVERGQWFRDGKHQGWYANERPQVRRRA